MKKLLIFFMITMGLMAFSLNVEEAYKVFSSLVEDYNSPDSRDQFVITVKKRLKDLSYYRFYRHLLIGSVERREFALNVGDFLVILYEEQKDIDREHKLAVSLFLCYVLSDMMNKNLSESSIKKNPAFNKFFEEYKSYLRKYSRNFFKWILGYYLGVYDEPPPKIINIQRMDLGYKQTKKEIPPDVLKEMNSFFSEKIEKEISSILNSVKENPPKDLPSLNRFLNTKALYLWRFLNEEISNLQNRVAKEAVDLIPKKRNIFWFRYLIYGIAVCFAIFLRKIRVPVFLAILLVETWFLYFLYNSTAYTDTMVYTMLIFFGFSFALLISVKRSFTRKRRMDVYLSILGVAFIVLVFFPRYIDVEELSMSKNQDFLNSPYYGFLKKDVYLNENSPFKKISTSLTSALLASREETKFLVEDLANFLNKLKEVEAVENVEVFQDRLFITTPSFSDFYSHRSFDERRKIFKEQGEKINEYLLNEATREKKAERKLKELKKFLKKITTYSAAQFVKDLEDYVENSFTRVSVMRPVYEDIKDIFKKDVSSEIPDLWSYQTKKGLALMLIFMLLFLFSVTKKWIMVLPSTVLASVLAVLSMIGHEKVSIFVQMGIKDIEITTNAIYNFGVEILVILLTLLTIYGILKKEV